MNLSLSWKMRAMWLATCRTIGCLCLLWASGCGGGISSSDVASSEESYQQAKTLADSKDWQGALAGLNKCIDTGGLNADLLSEALVYRARCHIELDKLSEATADLERAEMGSPPMDKFYVTRGLLAKKRGDTAAANKDFAAAKKISPKVQIP